MARISSLSLAQLLLSATGALAAIKVDVNDETSVKTAAKQVAEDLMTFYKGELPGEVPGILPGPPPDGDYYWWTGGALWSTMLDYRSRTGDTQYDKVISDGILFQIGPNNDFMPANWTASMGNDDQAIWAMASLLATETGFAEPDLDNLKWLGLGQKVFEEQSDDTRRVQNGSCAGGLRWQIYRTNAGYNWISTLANVAYANVGARLSQQDKTPAKSVEEAFDWLQTSKLIDSKFNVFDGADANDCDKINKLQFSAAAGLALEGAAVMFKSTGGDAKWKKLVDGLTQNTLDVFFPDGVATEVACEPAQCNTDMTFFKSFLHRGLATTMDAAPHTKDVILPVLKTSAAAAAESCARGENKRLCSSIWSGTPGERTGAGEQMSVLSALLSLLPRDSIKTPDSGSDSPTPSGGATPSPTGSPSSSTSGPPTSAGANTGVSAVVLVASLLLASIALN